MSDAARVDVDGGSAPLPLETVVAERFRVEVFLGRALSSDTYRGTDSQTGGKVSLRLIPLAPAERASLGTYLGRLSGLSHRNLCAVLAVGQHDGSLFIAAEAEDGHTLRQLIDARAQEGQAVGFAYAHTLLGHVATGLAELHNAGPHGALTPETILVSSAGRVKISELGVGYALPALALTGARAGSPPGVYQAPELSGGTLAPSPSSDVFSLGAILFELVTGAPPIPPLRPPSQLVPGLPPGLDAVVARAMAVTPQSRYATPQAFAEALARLATGAPQTTDDPPPAFDVAQAAGLGGDDQRWLLVKDRLDFGPFSMAQVMSQIERGQFGGDHVIVDMESGDRRPIKEHPALEDFVLHAERQLEAVRRQQAENVNESVERKKSRATVFILGTFVLALGAGLFLYMKNRRAAEDEVLASRVGEADIDAFVKNVKFDFAQRRRAAGRRQGGGKADEFSTNQNLGDVTKNGGDDVLGDAVVQRIMMGHYRSLVPCIMEERRRNPGLSDVDFEFVILGSGRVSAVRVNGQRNGAFPGCVLSRMQSFGFPSYNGSKTIASWSLSMR